MDVCREIRQNSSVPIIMLTAKSEEIDRVLGLELGADDYIVKPFSAREVVARVKAVLRRYSMQETEPAKILHYGNLEININNYDVRLNGERLPLTPKEVEILQLLASHPGKVFSREKILSIVWGYEYYGDTRAVDTQIKRIRQKLQSADDCGWEIKPFTVSATGLRHTAIPMTDRTTRNAKSCPKRRRHTISLKKSRRNETDRFCPFEPFWQK